MLFSPPALLVSSPFSLFELPNVVSEVTAIIAEIDSDNDFAIWHELVYGSSCHSRHALPCLRFRDGRAAWLFFADSENPPKSNGGFGVMWPLTIVDDRWTFSVLILTRIFFQNNGFPILRAWPIWVCTFSASTSTSLASINWFFVSHFLHRFDPIDLFNIIFWQFTHCVLLDAGRELDWETLRESEEDSGVGKCAPFGSLDLLQSGQSQLLNRVSQYQCLWHLEP